MQGLTSWGYCDQVEPRDHRHSLERGGWRITHFEKITQDMCLDVLGIVSHLSVVTQDRDSQVVWRTP